MGKQDYRNLSEDELIYRGSQLSEAAVCEIRQNEDIICKASSSLRRAIEQIQRKKEQSDKVNELIALTDDVLHELQWRLNFEMNPYRDDEYRLDDNLGEEIGSYYITFTFSNDKLLVDWNAWNGRHERCEFKRSYDEEGIPDVQLLQEDPVGWIAENLNGGKYRKSTDR